jgi:hypothetical protein
MSSIICPTCYWENPPNALECEKCRMSLQRKGSTKLLSEGVLPRYTEAPLIDIPKNTLVIVVSGHHEQPILIPSRRKIFLGRQFPGENPPIDLTNFGAHELGVSRQHAALTIYGQGYSVEDLASSNGTWLNALQLTPYVRYEVKSGDRLQLGRMTLFLYFDFTD